MPVRSTCLVETARRSRRIASLLVAAFIGAAAVGCATLTESTEQFVLVQTVLDHQPVSGIGCMLSNDVGRWFVTSPGRVAIRKSTQPLIVDCRTADVWAFDQVYPKQNSSRWGNYILTAGAGQYVDKNTGAGFDYPDTLTMILQRGEPPRAAPPGGTTVY
jgi:hypothetical protein